jgi:hypothetical protein
MERIEIRTYTPADFDTLLRTCPDLERTSALRHQPFVDHYYAGSPHGRLYLAVGADGRLSGTLGVEYMPFVHESHRWTVGFGSNFNSFRPGAGAYLFMRWLRSCDAGLAFGGTEDTHRILRRSRWTYYDGIRTFYLNHDYHNEPGERWARKAAKAILKAAAGRTPLHRLAQRLPQAERAGLEVRETLTYDPRLTALASPFRFRFAPDAAYLAWRYGTALGIARYRLFEIHSPAGLAGYVVVQDSPTRLIVAHCDGTHPNQLAAGVVLALTALAAGPGDDREVLLATASPAMCSVFQGVGFQNRARWDRPFAMGRTRGPVEVKPPPADWLVNFDWGDNGLRTPFRDQALHADAPSPALA